jgi:hypothetical protein
MGTYLSGNRQHFATVQIHFTDGNGWVRSYKAVIDAHTGELLRDLISK